MIAFSFLTVTLLMLINFELDYWVSSLAMLATKHCFDMAANIIDLVAFSRRNIQIMRYRVPLDVLSIALTIAIQVKLYKADDYRIDGPSDVTSLARPTQLE